MSHTTYIAHDDDGNAIYRTYHTTQQTRPVKDGDRISVHLPTGQVVDDVIARNAYGSIVTVEHHLTDHDLLYRSVDVQ